MIVASASKIVSFFVVSKVIKNEEGEIYQYGLELIISSVLNIIAVLVVSIIMNRLLESICFLTFFITLRSYAGGIHASNYSRCFLSFISIYFISIILSEVIPISFQSEISIIAMICISFIIILFSPVADANKPLDLNETKKYKKISIVIVLLQTILVAIVIVMNFHIERLIFSSMTGSFSAALLVLAAKIIKRKE